MKRLNFLSFAVFSAFLFTSLTKVQAVAAEGSSYEEVSYDDLVQRLSKKKSKLSDSSLNSFDDIMIHAGAGLVTSVSSYNINQKDVVRQHTGFQLSFGIDLFSPNWSAEAALRNFGTGNSGTESRSLRETDMKIMYRSTPNGGMGFRGGAGLATRYLKINDDMNGISINDTTPALIGFLGADSYVNKNFSVGFEAGLRSAMVGRTVDKNSLDFMLRLDTYF